MDIATPDILVGSNTTPEPTKDNTADILNSSGSNAVTETPEEAQKRKIEEGRQKFTEQRKELPLDIRKNFLDVGVPEPTSPSTADVKSAFTPTSPPTEPILPSTEAIGDTNAAAVESETAPETEVATLQQGNLVTPDNSEGTFRPEEPEPEIKFNVADEPEKPKDSSEAKPTEPPVFPEAADQSGKQEISSTPNTIDEKPKDEKPAETKPITAETLEEKYEKIMKEIKEQGKEGIFYVTIGTDDNEAIILPVAINTPGKFSNRDVLLLVSKQGIAEIDLYNHAVTPLIRDPLTLAEERKQMDEAQLETIKTAIEKYNKPRLPKEQLREGIFRENGRLNLRLFDPKSPRFNKFIDFNITSEIPDPEKLKKAIDKSKERHAATKETVKNKQVQELLRKKAEIANEALKVL
jgi:hypothetical protein